MSDNSGYLIGVVVIVIIIGAVLAYNYNEHHHHGHGHHHHHHHYESMYDYTPVTMPYAADSSVTLTKSQMYDNNLNGPIFYVTSTQDATGAHSLTLPSVEDLWDALHYCEDDRVAGETYEFSVVNELNTAGTIALSAVSGYTFGTGADATIAIHTVKKFLVVFTSATAATIYLA